MLRFTDLEGKPAWINPLSVCYVRAHTGSHQEGTEIGFGAAEVTVKEDPETVAGEIEKALIQCTRLPLSMVG